MDDNDASSRESTAVEAEIVKAPPMQPSTPRSVTVSPNTLRKQMERDKQIRQVISDYIKNSMVEGKDFGRIEVKKGSGIMSKPSLFKPGAEKFCGLFKIRPTFRRDPETVEMFGTRPGILAYICELVDSRGGIVGEGRGASSVDPSANDFDINKAIKIAEKRAQIDAVLRAGGLSDFFTQDMEDAPRSASQPAAASTELATDKQRALIARKLDEIGVHGEQQRNWLEREWEAKLPLTKDAASNIISEMLNDGA